MHKSRRPTVDPEVGKGAQEPSSNGGSRGRDGVLFLCGAFCFCFCEKSVFLVHPEVIRQRPDGDPGERPREEGLPDVVGRLERRS